MTVCVHVGGGGGGGEGGGGHIVSVTCHNKFRSILTI